ncbi:MAG TPA: hypothetical protein VFR24_02635 [Candidatus Angelobacter sp.]|nr:hypothetical protein [Candidatus Angelobacter sp.]
MIARDWVIGDSEATNPQIEQNGYAIVPAIFFSEEVQELALKLETADLPRSRAGIRHLLSHPAIAQIANDSRLLRIAQSVLGRDAFPFRATLFDKSPDANWLITWHQDTALPLREKHEIPGSLFATIDSTSLSCKTPSISFN